MRLEQAESVSRCAGRFVPQLSATKARAIDWWRGWGTYSASRVWPCYHSDHGRRRIGGSWRFVSGG